MIFLSRLNKEPFVVNSDLIEHIEANPDTVLALATGEKILVRESLEEVVKRVIDFRRAILSGLPACASSAGRAQLRSLDSQPSTSAQLLSRLHSAD